MNQKHDCFLKNKKKESKNKNKNRSISVYINYVRNKMTKFEESCWFISF